MSRKGFFQTPAEGLLRAREFVVSAAYLFVARRRRHTRCSRDWSSDVCSSDLAPHVLEGGGRHVRVADQVVRLLDQFLVGIAADPHEGRVAMGDLALGVGDGYQQLIARKVRSEERRVGKECRSRWSRYH